MKIKKSKCFRAFVYSLFCGMLKVLVFTGLMRVSERSYRQYENTNRTSNTCLNLLNRIFTLKMGVDLGHYLSCVRLNRVFSVKMHLDMPSLHYAFTRTYVKLPILPNCALMASNCRGFWVCGPKRLDTAKPERFCVVFTGCLCS